MLEHFEQHDSHHALPFWWSICHLVRLRNASGDQIPVFKVVSYLPDIELFSISDDNKERRRWGH
jgi:hypothetical protein